MAPFTTPAWVRWWLGISSVIVVWDASYCFLRPRSLPGGDLTWLFLPYGLANYHTVDYLYGFPALEKGDGFVNAQAFMNIVETVLNLACLALGDDPAAPLVGIIALAMTASKTDLYFLQDYYCGWCNTGQNSRLRWWTAFCMSNGTWLVMPALAAIHLGLGLANSLRRSAAGGMDAMRKVQ